MRSRALLPVEVVSKLTARPETSGKHGLFNRHHRIGRGLLILSCLCMCLSMTVEASPRRKARKRGLYTPPASTIPTAIISLVCPQFLVMQNEPNNTYYGTAYSYNTDTGICSYIGAVPVYGSHSFPQNCPNCIQTVRHCGKTATSDLFPGYPLPLKTPDFNPLGAPVDKAGIPDFPVARPLGSLETRRIKFVTPASGPDTAAQTLYAILHFIEYCPSHTSDHASPSDRSRPAATTGDCAGRRVIPIGYQVVTPPVSEEGDYQLLPAERLEGKVYRIAIADRPDTPQGLVFLAEEAE